MRGRYVLSDRASGDTLGTGRYTTLWRQSEDGPRAIFDFGEGDQ